jgi:D-arabinose 1-dehydrogenase-like Zn-dependent alcohol dehydrogenase
VVLGLAEEGFHFDAINLTFHEIVVKGGLHASVEDMTRMLEVAAEHKVRSQLTIVPIDEGENLLERSTSTTSRGKW